jgi:hypothetical protein
MKKHFFLLHKIRLRCEKSQEVSDFIRASSPSQYGQQYAQVFEGNFIDGKRFLKLGMNHLPQMGIQRFDHMKLIFKKIEKVFSCVLFPSKAGQTHLHTAFADRSFEQIQKIAAEYEQQQLDSDLKMQFSVVKIQSLARGSISRKKVEHIQNERKMKEYEMYAKLQVGICHMDIMLHVYDSKHLKMYRDAFVFDQHMSIRRRRRGNWLRRHSKSKSGPVG